MQQDNPSQPPRQRKPSRKDGAPTTMDFETNASQVRDDPQPGAGGGEEQEGVWLKEDKHGSDGEFLRGFLSAAAERNHTLSCSVMYRA